ncbi:IS200/IS605 family transposase [Bifidobacterium longum]|uniref:IS200/IS605 family transposase n=1 Tax=Bifidobacterium longum TaxID=216816 RepID=UPI00374E7ACC
MRRTDKVKHNNNVTYRCHYHVVWCPKYRRKVITSLDPTLHNPPIEGDPGPVDERLKQIIRDVCDETGSELLELETMPDHVHLLVDCDPQYGINRLIRLIKGRTSRYLRREFPSLKRRIPTLWTNSYFVATVGGAPLTIVKQYIENQRNV